MVRTDPVHVKYVVTCQVSAQRSLACDQRGTRWYAVRHGQGGRGAGGRDGSGRSGARGAPGGGLEKGRGTKGCAPFPCGGSALRSVVLRVLLLLGAPDLLLESLVELVFGAVDLGGGAEQALADLGFLLQVVRESLTVVAEERGRRVLLGLRGARGRCGSEGHPLARTAAEGRQVPALRRLLLDQGAHLLAPAGLQAAEAGQRL